MSTPPQDLSPGDRAFLGMLELGLRTAYEIKKAMAGSISFFWSAAHSQVYQQAARLVRDGYVRERVEPGGRRRKLLALTPKGRRALRAWLTTPAGPVELRDEMLVKVFFAALAGDAVGTRAVLEDQRSLYADVLAEFERIDRMLVEAERADEHGHARFQRLTVGLGLRVMRAYLDWLDETIPQIRDQRPRTRGPRATARLR